MIKSKYFKLLVSVAVLCFALPCVGRAQGKKSKVVFNAPNLAFPWTAFTAKAARDEGSKLGVDVLVQDGQGSSSKQSSDLRNAVNQGVDAIVLTPNDVLQALQQTGAPKGKVMVLGYDAIPEALAKVRSGEMAATVEQLPGQQVKNAMDAVAAHLKEKKPLEPVKLDPILITKDNVNQAERSAELK